MYAALPDISYIAENDALGEGRWLSGESVGLEYPVWLLHNNDGRCNMLTQLIANYQRLMLFAVRVAFAIERVHPST